MPVHTVSTKQKAQTIGYKEVYTVWQSTNYVYHIEFYSGKSSLYTDDNTPFTEKVIFYLLTKSNVLDNCYHFFTDNFYTKVPLAKSFLRGVKDFY